MDVATKKQDIQALELMLARRKRIAALKAKIEMEEEALSLTEEFIKARHPKGLALELKGGKAKIVEFSVFTREYADMEAIKKLLHDRVPKRRVRVRTTRIIDGVIQ